MVTPFRDDLQLDLPAIAPLMRFFEARDVAGVFAICQSSEIFHLSFQERLTLLREVMRACSPGTAVLASGHISYDPQTQIEEAKSFAAEGIDAYVFISNRFAAAHESEDVFLRRAEHVAKALGDLPLGIYECPSPYKRLIPPQTLRRLTEVGNFAFLKDTCCSVEDIAAKLEAVRGTGLKLFNANAATLLESLRLGASGYSGVMANFHPQIYARLCACWQTDAALAERLQAFAGFASLAECQAYPTNAKYHLALCGVPMGRRCRCQDSDAVFPQSRQMEIKQMYASQAFAGL
jgi:4-hydroxy-tetrahydrodipicolinate synthase